MRFLQLTPSDIDNKDKRGVGVQLIVNLSNQRGEEGKTTLLPSVKDLAPPDLTVSLAQFG